MIVLVELPCWLVVSCDAVDLLPQIKSSSDL
jgi:hypothetical protein